MSNVIYANARAKALELTLLGLDRLNRMLDSETASDALKILTEINFGEGVNISSPLDFEELIRLEQNKLNDFIKNTCQEDGISKFFLFKNDYHNAEAFIKSKYLKIDVENMIVQGGYFDKEVLRDCIFNDDYKKLPKNLAKALLFLDGEFVAGRATGDTVNGEIIKALYSDLAEAVKSNKYLNEIFKAKVDFANVSMALRSRDYNKIKDKFLFGGNLTESQFKSLSEDSFDVIKETFKFSKYSNVILSAIDCAEKKIPLSDFEKLSSSFPVALLNKEKYSTDGSIPFMQYCFYKLADIENVRIIMVGLINGLDKNDVKNRLRDCYVG